MGFAHLGQRHHIAALVVAGRVDGLLVHPLGGVGVALDLHVLAQFLVADGTTLAEQSLDLLEHQGVALYGGGVVRLLEPDAAPCVGRLRGARQTAQPRPQLSDLGVEPVVEFLPRGPPAPLPVRNLFVHQILI